ncbi:MAG TPA: R3H domain-containing nucleic acid-binding protein [Solirubrobacteraceae bacterium]|jgi:spoIIIJ-associated protein|nr:R3H domain-containing nucleic acid-binding protein [Solirubrobacteraceae bacterium]
MIGVSHADDAEESAELLAEVLEEIADGLGVECRVSVELRDGVLHGIVEGDDVGRLIGRHGQTIDAVQHLAQRIVFPGGQPNARVVVDVDGYRERRERILHEDADAAADEALRMGESIELAPMPAAERRIVHEHLRERGDVRTHSEGEEPDRRLVVSPL